MEKKNLMKNLNEKLVKPTAVLLFLVISVYG